MTGLELNANKATATLATAYTAGSGTISVTGASYGTSYGQFPVPSGSQYFRVQCGSLIMKVTAVNTSTNVWTVTVVESTDTNVPSNTAVTAVLTAGEVGEFHQLGTADLTDADVAAANKDGTAATASLRTLGTGAQQAAAGNDSRLSDARTPTAHAASHESGGSDALPWGIILDSGTDAGKPAAAAGNDGYLYIATDTQKVYRSDGSAWSLVLTAGASGFVLYASQHGAALDSNLTTGGGTDDTTALQAILNVANSGGRVHLILDGPARVSGLNVYSNTTITCLEGAGFYLADSSERAIIRNVNRSRGSITDQNITLVGGVYNGNMTHQIGSGSGNQQESDNTFIVGLQFFGVNYLDLEGVTVLNARAYSVHLANVHYVSIDGLHTDYGSTQLTSGQDGLHINGPASLIEARNLTVKSWDDAVALNAGDGTVLDLTIANDLGPYVGQGLIQDVLIDGLKLDGAKNGPRLLSHDSNSRINRVRLCHVTGSVAVDYACVINPFGAGTGSFGDIALEDWTVDKASYGTANASEEAWLEVSGTIEALTLRGLRFHQPGNEAILLWFDDATVVNSLAIEDLSIYDDQSGAAGMVPIQLDGYVKDFRGRNWNWYRPTGMTQADQFLLLSNAASEIDVLSLEGVVANLVNNIVRQTAGSISYLQAAAVRHAAAGGEPTFYSSAGTISAATISNWYGDSLISGSVATTSGDAFPDDDMSVTGELLMTDGVTAPPVPLTTEAGDDWLYED